MVGILLLLLLFLGGSLWVFYIKKWPVLVW